MSHKCVHRGGDLACLVKDEATKCLLFQELARSGFSLLIDPFGPGVDVGARVETLECDALLFLDSHKSRISRWCQQELEMARRRSVPVFVVSLGPRKPRLVGSRIAVPASSLDAAGLSQLVAAMRVRAELYRVLRSLGMTVGVVEHRQFAQTLEDCADPAALAEFADSIIACCRCEEDPTAQAILVRALGRCQTKAAAAYLNALMTDPIHPLVKFEISEVLQRSHMTEGRTRQ